MPDDPIRKLQRERRLKYVVVPIAIALVIVALVVALLGVHVWLHANGWRASIA